MESYNCGLNLTFNNADLFATWKQVTGRTEQQAAILEYFKARLNSNTRDSCDAYLTEKSRQFCSTLSSKWQKCRRNLVLFKKRHAAYLNGGIVLDIEKKSIGRPALPYNLKTTSGQSKQAAKLSISVKNDVRLLLQAASIAARKRKQVDLAAVLNLLLISPVKANMIRKILSEPIEKPKYTNIHK